MADFEKIDIDVETAEAKFERSDFAQVIFHNIAETYPVDAHVDCRYTIRPSLNPTSRDWVGLYKVGWASPKDYIYFHWSPQEVAEEGQDIEAHVLFQAHTLPKDDGEFYQFCYVTRSGHVRGASTPFQFKKPCAEDFVEVEDTDTNMMIIETKTKVLEDEIKKASAEKTQLIKARDLLESERNSLLAKLVEYDKKLKADKNEKEDLGRSVQECKEKINNLTTEAKDMTIIHDSLREKLEEKKQEKDSILKRLDDNDCYIKSLQEKIKALINEKDSLCGKNKMLEEEKEMYKNHFTSSETVLQGYVAEIDNLKKQLNHHELEVIKHKEEVSKTQQTLNSESKKLKRQQSVSRTDQQHIGEITEQLRNSEDKLTAAEHCKKLLNEEIIAMQMAHDKMSQDLEETKSEAHSLKLQLQRAEDIREKTATEAKTKIEDLEKQIKEFSQEKETLEVLNDELNKQIQCIQQEKHEEQEGPLFALQMAHKNLKDRYEKIRSQNEELKRQLDDLLSRQQQAEESSKEGEKERQDLKERLAMGADEYKQKYIECLGLQKELRRIKKQARSGRGTPEKTSESKCVETEQLQNSDSSSQTAVACEDKETNVQPADCEDEDLADSTAEELKTQIDNMTRDLQDKFSRKQKYKQMYQEEKEKCSFLQKMYHEELMKKDDDIKSKCEDMKKLEIQIEQMKDDYAQKLKNLQDTIDRQAQELETLKADQPPKVVYPPQVLQYPNPYVTPQTSAPPTPPSSPFKMQYGNPYTAPTAPLHIPATDESRSGSSSPDIDLDAEDPPLMLDKPLTPLPPPIEPEKLPSAKVAIVKAINDPMLESTLSLEGTLGASGGEAVEPAGPVREHTDVDDDRFHDADGDPQKLCPVCQVTFPVDLSQRLFEEHVDSHYGPECPMCQKRFDSEQKQEEFEKHVQAHFEAEN